MAEPGAPRGYTAGIIAAPPLVYLTSNPWLLACLVPTHIVMHFGVIRREERYLEAQFGEE